MSINKFYDIHFHIMDLSHTNITAYINRLMGVKSLSKSLFKNIITLPKSLLNILKSTFSKNSYSSISINKTKNLLSFMEGSIKYDFLIVDYFLKNRDRFVTDSNEFSVGEHRYNKIVLCPLIMDFGYQSLDNSDVFYNIPPQKTIKDQIEDLFKSINYYYNKSIHIVRHSDRVKFNTVDFTGSKDEKLFEIYPFMGLNTKNYTFDEVKDLLDKYFSEFSREDSKEQRQLKLYNKMGEFSGDLDSREQCKNIFAGIKLYPPLGFEPWPKDLKQREKVKYLYNTCIEKKIPITVHCGTGGFYVHKRGREFTDPDNQWKKVLDRYSGLKINFAHFGFGKKRWQKSIIKLAEGRSGVYTDFSYNIEKENYYKKLSRLFNKNPKLEDRVLFGSDFMINLLRLNSYNEYLNCYSKTEHLSNEIKRKVSNINTESFLFS